MNFEYHKPSSSAAAANLLEDGATAIAGGMTLLPAIKHGLADPNVLVDLTGLDDLTGISEHAIRGLVIGAMVTHAEVASSDLVKSKIPALAALANGIGDPQVRHRGTLGGSLANNDPAADYPAGLLGLGGSVHTNKRVIKASDFFTGLFTTALGEGEMIMHVHFDIPEQANYIKFAQPASRYALVGVMVAKAKSGIRVAVTGAGADGVFRASELEEALSDNFSSAALEHVVVPARELLSDLHGSAEYRRHLTTILTKRALA